MLKKKKKKKKKKLIARSIGMLFILERKTQIYYGGWYESTVVLGVSRSPSGRRDTRLILAHSSPYPSKVDCQDRYSYSYINHFTLFLRRVIY